MSSTRGVLLGAQAPRVAKAPSFHWSHADDASFLATSYGLTPDEWQHSVLESWLGEDRRGKWVAGRCGLAVPRQNGKNGIIEVRELYGMVALGEKFLHTAHEVKTARKAFLRLCGFFENERRYPELAALVQEIRKTNGQEAIVLTNGASVEFVARSRGSGRGYTVDVLVMDEAQELSDEALEALLPTISAAPRKNPQTILTGTPPGPGSVGEVFTRTRDAGVAGNDRRLSWHEWSVDGHVDVSDRNLWAATNPALGTRLNLSVLEDELASMSEDGFARERLGRWASDATTAVIPSATWAGRLATDPPAADARPTALALDMSHDRTVAVAACWSSDDGPHVELVALDAALDSFDVVALLVKMAGRRVPVVVDSLSPAASLVPDLRARHVKVITTGSTDMQKACGGFYDDVVSDRLTHAGQESLTDAVHGAKKRKIGDAGGWGWDRKDPTVNIAPLVAATLARFGAAVTKKKSTGPTRIVVLS